MATSFETTEFIQALKQHDPVTFETLYESVGSKIFNLAYRLTQSEEDASDITQETFLQVYRNIPSFRGDSQLFTWIYSIAQNICYRILTKRKRSSFLSTERLIHAAIDVKTPEGIIESDMVNLTAQVKEGCLIGLVRCLPFNQRMAFISHALLHLPIQEVSQILDKSEGATKLLIYRARGNLKNFLCKNCSLYNPENFCHCKNLIGFSLKQGWVFVGRDRKNKSSTIDAGSIEDEVQNFHEILLYFNDLDPVIPPGELRLRISSLLADKDWAILHK
jgi:RNA polymerase sigma-70 factor, ECF subfamily